MSSAAAVCIESTAVALVSVVTCVPSTPPQVAALEHFMTQPASFLAAAALEGRDAVETELADLDPASLREVGAGSC